MLYGFIAVMALLGSVLRTLYWVTENSRQHRPHTPEWAGTLYFVLWVAWAGYSAQLLIPQVFNLLSLVELLRGPVLAWLIPALIWLGGAIVAPAALLFAVRWALARIQRKRKEQDRTLPGEKFDPIGYCLNWKHVFSIPAVAVYDGGDAVTTTVGKILNEILPGRFIVPGEPEGTKAPVPDSEKYMGSVTVKTPDGRTVRVESMTSGKVASARFAAELVDGILKLFRITEEAVYCVLYFYEHDSGSHEATWWEHYKFFVVHQDKIVMDGFELSSLCGDFFDHTVLIPMHKTWPWRIEPAVGADDEDDELTPGQKTGLRWWYRRFYTETRTGQVKVFWNERLYNYVPPEQREAARDARLRRVEFGVLGIAGLLVAHYVFKWF
jgi:hypothetical protein